MQKNILYAVAFVVLVLLQIFLIDNIYLGIYFHPFIYTAFIIILPLDMKHIWVMLLATLMGLTIDLLTGTGGLNVIAATAVGFLRPALLNAAIGHRTSADESMLALHRLQSKNLRWYILLATLMHGVIFFMLDSISLSNLHHTLLRLLVSCATSAVLIWYIVKLFIEKIIIK